MKIKEIKNKVPTKNVKTHIVKPKKIYSYILQDKCITSNEIYQQFKA